MYTRRRGGLRQERAGPNIGKAIRKSKLGFIRWKSSDTKYRFHNMPEPHNLQKVMTYIFTFNLEKLVSLKS